MNKLQPCVPESPNYKREGTASVERGGRHGGWTRCSSLPAAAVGPMGSTCLLVGQDVHLGPLSLCLFFSLFLVCFCGARGQAQGLVYVCEASVPPLRYAPSQARLPCSTIINKCRSGDVL